MLLEVQIKKAFRAFNIILARQIVEAYAACVSSNVEELLV